MNKVFGPIVTLLLALAAGTGTALSAASDHWAFRAVPARVDAPASRGGDRNPIDSFIRARLAKAGLTPSPEADRISLIRRLFLDMQGLPPTPEQVAAFIHSREADAYERLVEEVLDSPRYGERWAQHWLDVVRYADTHGYEVNTPRTNAWPYRDYVIDAFNRDKPYDQFVFEQLAGDSVEADSATGFLVASAVLLPGQIGADDASKRQARQDALDEIIVGTSETFLGLSIGCARCHNHKFDPISQRDYYAMQAFFAGVEYGDRPVNNASTRAMQLEHARMIFAGTFREPDVTKVLSRGDSEQPGDTIGPSVLALFGDLALPLDASEQSRRVALAHWIARENNPLTARVMANRVWQYHFGHGLVDTPSDFGMNGAAPSHPELLNWLAREFIRGGWSMKHLHRLILLSATYRQSSQMIPQALAIDGDCRLLWRFPSRRLEAEAIRDSILCVNGRLNARMGGPGFDFFKSRGGLDGFPPVERFGPEGWRRMIYAHKVRMERVPVFGAFDCPDAGQAMPRRRQSMTAIQALNLFNSPFMAEQAKALAQRIEQEAGKEPPAQVRRAFQLAFGREPSEAEAAASEAAVREHGLATLSRALYNSNEFLFAP